MRKGSIGHILPSSQSKVRPLLKEIPSSLNEATRGIGDDLLKAGTERLRTTASSTEEKLQAEQMGAESEAGLNQLKEMEITTMSFGS